MVLISSILSSLILVDQKSRLIQNFQESVSKQWDRWELRGLVLISLALQIFLIYSGNRRKYIAKRWIRACIWSAYLMADWIATLALGILRSSFHSPNNNNDNGDLRLMAFWAPFLLLHLGGPDTITAYALADNELWLRHLLGLVVQTFAAIYITFLSWDNTLLSFLAIPMILCGIVKYGERTWVLNSADLKNIQLSFLGTRDTSGVNFVRFMEEFNLREAEGYLVTAAPIEEGRSPRDYLQNTTVTTPFNHFRDILLRANYFYETLQFKRLLVDLVLSFHERDESLSFFGNYESESAFQVIEYELGLAYDVFYTKAPIIYTRFGFIFRLFTFLTTLSVSVAFVLAIVVRPHKHLLVDVVITCILLIGAFLLELFAAISSLSSDWAILWLSRLSSKVPCIAALVMPLQVQFAQGKRWSHSMYQYSLLEFCLAHQKSSTFYKILSFIPFGGKLKSFWVEYWVSFRHQKHLMISPDLSSFIFQHFGEISRDPADLKIFLTRPWEVALKTHKKYNDLKWTVEVEFDHIILIWHIATDICYKGDKSNRLRDGTDGIKQEWDDHMEYSKQLADYMLYLLVKCPFMLPIGIGMVRFQDTCIQALALLEEKISWESKYDDVYDMLGQVGSKSFPGTLKVDDLSESVLFEACNRAARLKNMGSIEMWKMVSDVWVDILGYAAGQCNGFKHVQQLEKGGELLTHVWLLMAHLGITKHFKEESHGRAKLRIT